MYYLKILFLSFLIVFFSNYLLPGVQVESISKIPQIGGDLIFALSLGLLNALIYPVLKLSKKGASTSRIILFALSLNMASYGLVQILPFGIHTVNIESYLIASLTVTLGSSLMNLFEMKHNQPPEVEEEKKE